ncbi:MULTISPECIES: hypothetical protein [Microcella]|uniref:hypothetical protein n=1 Tax=Microcella TaxID=337004 RepID=UPI0015CF035B|nr:MULTISPECIES: hypothetical protein [Microcella]MBU1250765.1 hypothetical protein [Actinomycetota bacterium]MBU1607964.1 hypothetical protein [Actinomycetota bacterium]MBU2316140.1 hypothetical protein [Actinomycetota bacterium]MBU2386188.1 hypothetical protein [Actinomycetota bacterium]QOD94261.1 hypothetical protein IE160_03245 [Chryseoglobus sp. 28M-23]
MNAEAAFPIPTDAATAAWAGPVFALMALTVVALLIWQAVRYFRDEHDDDDGPDGDRTQ